METANKEKIGNEIVTKLIEDVKDLKDASKVLAYCYTEIRNRVKDSSKE